MSGSQATSNALAVLNSRIRLLSASDKAPFLISSVAVFQLLIQAMLLPGCSAPVLRRASTAVANSRRFPRAGVLVQNVIDNRPSGSSRDKYFSSASMVKLYDVASSCTPAAPPLDPRGHAVAGPLPGWLPGRWRARKLELSVSWSISFRRSCGGCCVHSSSLRSRHLFPSNNPQQRWGWWAEARPVAAVLFFGHLFERSR